MGGYKSVDVDDVNDFLRKYEIPLPEIESEVHGVNLLFRIIEYQQAQISRLREDINLIRKEFE